MSDAARVALFVRLEAKAGKEAELEKFLRGGLALVQQETGHKFMVWYSARADNFRNFRYLSR